MQNILVRPAPVKGAREAFAICDLPGFAALADSVPMNPRRTDTRANNRWRGSKDWDVSVQQVREGDLSGVAASDKLLESIEAQTLMTKVWRNRLDVVGGAPCVPAFLAGQPYNMRRRERVAVEQGPLTILASLELSADISIETMRKRGAAILALVRLLSNSRPIDLWACCSIGNFNPKTAAHVAIKIDTAPLDLARAAHVLTDCSVTRGLCYGLGEQLLNEKLGCRGEWSGDWAYGDVSEYRRTARDNFVSVLNPSSEAIWIAAAHSNDPMVNNPVEWLKTMLHKHGGITEDMAA